MSTGGRGRKRRSPGVAVETLNETVSRRAISQNHGRSCVSTFRRARWTVRSSDFVHRLSCHFGGLGASQHANGDAGGCEIGEGHGAGARGRGTATASGRSIRRGDHDRDRSLTRRTSHFDDQARAADQRAGTGADDVAPRAKRGEEHESDRQHLARNWHRPNPRARQQG